MAASNESPGAGGVCTVPDAHTTDTAAPPPTIIVLASGRGERFIASGGSGSKLQARIGDRTVLECTLQAVRASGLPWHLEDAGHPGMGDSIGAAVRSTPDANGWLILPGDLPLIQADSLRAIAAALRTHDAVMPRHLGQRGHPVGFGRRFRAALMALTGAQGAAQLLRGQPVHELELDDRGCVTDIDTLAELDAARRLLAATLPPARG